MMVFFVIKKNGLRFDLGAMEVGPISDHPNSDTKLLMDRLKLIKGMRYMLGCIRDQTNYNPKVQVIGVLCSGWNITLLQMAYHDNYLVDYSTYSVHVLRADLHELLDLINALIRHKVCTIFLKS